MQYILDFSLPTEDSIWDRSFIESLPDPDTLLTQAILGETRNGLMQISKFGINVDVARFTITSDAQVPEPSSAALVALGLVLLAATWRRAKLWQGFRRLRTPLALRANK